jgi:hypothetical protein
MKERTQSAESYADRLNFTSERLRNIVIKDTDGTKKTARGWSSVLVKDKDGERYDPLVEETQDSTKTPFKPLILLVPPELLGTHEATDPDHIPVEGEDKKGFEGIDFTNGWNGSPLACACFAICNEDEVVKSDIYPSIFRRLTANKGVALLDQFEYGDFGVLDGHHRRRYAAEGPIRLKYVPIQIIPYLYDCSVVLRTWHADNNYWKAQRVFECFKKPDDYADAKRTKFGVVGKDGIIRRILDTQPNVTIPLHDLI